MGENMTIESVALTIRWFLHFMATMVVALLVCCYIALIIAKYGGWVTIKMGSSAFFLIPCLIVAAVYTWPERPKKALHEKRMK
jgi:hypothetical protein